MDCGFSNTEMTDEGKTINVNVDDIASRVELFRPAESSGNAGWSVIDCADGERVTVESDMPLAAAKHRAMEYLVELEDRGENLYYAEPTEEDDADGSGSTDPADESDSPVDADAPKPYVDNEGQQRLFSPEQGVPMDAEYTDERHEKIAAKYEKSKTELAEAIENRKNLNAIIKMREANHHHDRIEKVIDDARCESMKKLGRGIVPIAHFSKMMTITASDVHAYSYEETKFFQAFVNGMPVSLDEAIEADRIAKGAAKETIADDAEVETVEGEYRCPVFERDTVTATSLKSAMKEMMCSPEDENSGCFDHGCKGPAAVEVEAEEDTETTVEDSGENEADVDLSDLPGFGDEGDQTFAQERAV